MNDKIEHLKMIQGIITRMASNSLQVKCWNMAIVAVIIAFADGRMILAGITPIVLFCYLDAKYLAQEKTYRDLYDKVRVKNDTEIDFSMKTEKGNIKYGLKSWSVWLFYLVLSLTVIIIALYRMC